MMCELGSHKNQNEFRELHPTETDVMQKGDWLQLPSVLFEPGVDSWPLQRLVT